MRILQFENVVLPYDVAELLDHSAKRSVDRRRVVAFLDGALKTGGGLAQLSLREQQLRLEERHLRRVALALASPRDDGACEFQIPVAPAPRA